MDVFFGHISPVFDVIPNPQVARTGSDVKQCLISLKHLICSLFNPPFGHLLEFFMVVSGADSLL